MNLYLKDAKEYLKRLFLFSCVIFSFAMVFNAFYPKGYRLRGKNDNVIKINTQLAYEKYKKGEILIFDARSELGYYEMRIKGALLYPASEYRTLFYDYKDLIEKTDSVYVYCDNPKCGLADSLAQDIAHDYKSKNVYIISGGIESWHEEGYPVEKGGMPYEEDF